MADLRWHVVLGGRPLAGWCANVCTSAFFLQHAVRINYAGKTAMIFGGVGFSYYGAAGDTLQRVALVNAIFMLGDQFFYSVFWGSPAAIAAFVAPDQRLGGTPRQQHVLHTWGTCPNVLLVMTVGYYSVFAALFAVAASLEPHGSAALAYAAAACAWHVWVAALLAWGAMLGGVLHRTTNATAPELQKLVGVARGAAAELPLSQETPLIAVRAQQSLPQATAQLGERSRNGLFRFEQLSVRVQT